MDDLERRIREFVHEETGWRPGCNQQDILNHLRQPGEHCRGCFALDLVLGKE